MKGLVNKEEELADALENDYGIAAITDTKKKFQGRIFRDYVLLLYLATKRNVERMFIYILKCLSTAG